MDIRGRDGDDLITAGSGNDDIRGDGGVDSLVAGDGDDTIRADSIDDDFGTINGGVGYDTLRANDNAVMVDWVLLRGMSIEEARFQVC